MIKQALVEQDVHEGQLITPKMDLCRQRITHPIGAGGEITTMVVCVAPKGHQNEPHLSHPFKNIFSGEIEYLVWSDNGPQPKADFVVCGFDQFTCKSCHVYSQYHEVPEECWNCGVLNDPSNYDFDP